VEEICYGGVGVVERMGGGILVDHSTISPIATRGFAERAAELGVSWIDAPVSGGSEGARDGNLAVMAGGDPGALDTVRGLIDAYAASVVHVGEAPGSGQMAKMVNQALVVVNQLAASEGLLLAQAAGLDLEATLRAVGGGAAGSWMLSNRGPQMIERDWSPGFTIDLQQKDLRLVLEAADELGVPLPGTALVFQLYRALQTQGLGDEGNHALVKALETLSGIRLGEDTPG
jgi:3-hydroxyisobutyrate dehydrogenase-like beta-hydroxyacid dehydrogenase